MLISLSERVVFSTQGDSGFVAGDPRNWHLCVVRGERFVLFVNGKELGEFENAYTTAEEGEGAGQLGLVLYGPEGEYMAAGGELWGPYGGLRGVRTAGSSWAAVDLEDEGTYFLINGRKLGPFHTSERASPSLSADGSQWGFLYGGPGGWFVRVGDLTLGPYEDASGPVFPDSAQGFACSYAKEGGVFVRVNLRELGPYEEVWGLKFSPDGSRWGFFYSKGGKTFARIGEAVLGPFEGVGELALSHKLWAFSYRDGGKWFVVVNGRRVGPYPELSCLRVAGKHLGFLVSQGEESWALLDGKPTGRDFSPTRLGWAGFWWLSKYDSEAEEAWLLVWGERLGPFRWTPEVKASSGHWCVAAQDSAYWLLMDGRKTGPFLDAAVVSGDLAYAVRRKGKKLELVRLTP